MLKLYLKVLQCLEDGFRNDNMFPILGFLLFMVWLMLRMMFLPFDIYHELFVPKAKKTVKIRFHYIKPPVYVAEWYAEAVCAFGWERVEE